MELHSKLTQNTSPTFHKVIGFPWLSSPLNHSQLLLFYLYLFRFELMSMNLITWFVEKLTLVNFLLFLFLYLFHLELRLVNRITWIVRKMHHFVRFSVPIFNFYYYLSTFRSRLFTFRTLRWCPGQHAHFSISIITFKFFQLYHIFHVVFFLTYHYFSYSTLVSQSTCPFLNFYYYL